MWMMCELANLDPLILCSFLVKFLLNALKSSKIAIYPRLHDIHELVELQYLHLCTYGSAFGSLIILYDSALNELKYIYTLNLI